jgi:MFS family permease
LIGSEIESILLLLAVRRLRFYCLMCTLCQGQFGFFVSRNGLNPLILGSLIDIFAAFVPAPVFSLVPKFLPAGQAGLGYGILSSFLNVGVLVGPFLIGFSIDQAQSYLPGFNLMALFALVTAILALILRVVKS